MINWALFGSYLLSIVIMIGLPIALAILVTRRFRISWWVVLVGVATYAAFQGIWTLLENGFSSGALPLPPTSWPTLVQVGLFSLLAVILEQGLVWAGYMLLRKMTKPYGASLAMGVSHGGAQIIVYAVLGVIVPLWPIVTFNGAAEIASGVPTATVSQMLSSYSQFWAQPFYVGLLPGFQQLITFSLQMVLAILIWKAVVNHNGLWLILVLVYQTIFYLFNTFIGTLGLPSYVSIGILFLFFLVNAYLIYRFTTDEIEYEQEEEEEGEEDEDGEAESEDEQETANEENEKTAGDEDEEDPESDDSK